MIRRSSRNRQTLLLLITAIFALSTGMARAQVGLPPTDETVAIIRAEIAELEAQRQILEQRIQNAALRMARAVADAEQAEARLAEMLENADVRLGDMEALRSERAEAEQARDASLRERDDLRAEIERLNADVERARQEAIAPVAQDPPEPGPGDVDPNTEDQAAMAAAALDKARAELSDTEAIVAERQNSLATLEKQIDIQASALREAQARVAAIRVEEETLGEAIEARANSTVSSDSGSESIEAEEDMDAGDKPVSPLAAPETGPQRERAAAAAALDAAPGLDAISEEQRAALTDSLSSGLCVVDALWETTGAINRHTAAALRRDLEGC